MGGIGCEAGKRGGGREQAGGWTLRLGRGGKGRDGRTRGREGSSCRRGGVGRQGGA